MRRISLIALGCLIAAPAMGEVLVRGWDPVAKDAIVDRSTDGHDTAAEFAPDGLSISPGDGTAPGSGSGVSADPPVNAAADFGAPGSGGGLTVDGGPRVGVAVGN